MTTSVIPLAAQSCFSLLHGVMTPEALVDWAAGQGLPALGIADRGNFYGLVRFVKAARARGIRPVAGMHFQSGGEPGVMAWCLDRPGFRALNELASACLERYGPHPTEAAEAQAPERPGRQAAARGAVRPGGEAVEDFVLGWFRERGWAGMALAVAPGPGLEGLAALAAGKGTAWPKDDLLVAAWWGRPFLPARQAARRLGLQAIALNPGLWRDPAERRTAAILRGIATRCSVERLPAAERPGDGARLLGAAELADWFAACPEMLLATQALAERADAGRLIASATVFPAWGEPEEAEAELRRRCREGLESRYPLEGVGAALRRAAEERLEREFEIIRRKGFVSYFLVVNDIVAQAPRTCGRGSAAASIVAYLLGITHVEPLEHQLFFERFLNDERKDPPDIDVDFPWDERARVLAWVFERYPGRAAMVADHVTFASRSALRESALALGYPLDEVDRFARLWLAGQRESIPGAVREAARAIAGLPRNIGLHPGGVVITPEPIHAYSHTQTSLAGWPVLAWEKDAAEDAGLVKIDLLGNRSLAVLRDSLAMLRHKRARPMAWGSHECLDDAATRALVEKGQTLGVFYVESPATRQLLRKMGTADYEHLVVASSIIRPAANRFIAEYVRRLHGGAWQPLHPLVAEVLAETLGIMVYQEDVSRVAIAVAGFSAGEADGLRKVLSRKDREARLAAFWLRFRDGARGKGVGDAVIQALWDMILSFDGYSFCKSHSASYALVSYQLAWVRAWHPLEFFTAVINNGGGFYGRQVYLNELRRLGFPLRGPDVNASAEAAVIQEGGFRLGLSQISALSGGFIMELLAERERGGPFASLEDFLGRMAPGPAELRALIRSGSLDGIAGGLTRPQLFWATSGQPLSLGAGAGRGSRAGRGLAGGPAGAAAPRPAGVSERALARNSRSRTFPRLGEAADGPGARAALRPRGSRQGGLFAEAIAVPPSIGDYRPETKLADEQEYLGLLWSCHPLEVFAPRIRRLRQSRQLEPLIDSRSIGQWVKQRVSIAGTVVAEKEVWTRKADTMCFLSFEDPWGIFETVVFPEAWERLSQRLMDAYAFVVQGRVQWDTGALTIQIEDLIVLNRVEPLPARRPGALAAGGLPLRE